MGRCVDVKYSVVFKVKGKEKTIHVDAMYDSETRFVYDIDKYNVPNNYEATGEQYITLPSGEELDVDYKEGNYYAKRG